MPDPDCAGNLVVEFLAGWASDLHNDKMSIGAGSKVQFLYGPASVARNAFRDQKKVLHLVLIVDLNPRSVIRGNPRRLQFNREVVLNVRANRNELECVAIRYVPGAVKVDLKRVRAVLAPCGVDPYGSPFDRIHAPVETPVEDGEIEIPVGDQVRGSGARANLSGDPSRCLAPYGDGFLRVALADHRINVKKRVLDLESKARFKQAGPNFTCVSEPSQFELEIQIMNECGAARREHARHNSASVDSRVGDEQKSLLVWHASGEEHLLQKRESLKCSVCPDIVVCEAPIYVRRVREKLARALKSANRIVRTSRPVVSRAQVGPVMRVVGA